MQEALDVELLEQREEEMGPAHEEGFAVEGEE